MQFIAVAIVLSILSASESPVSATSVPNHRYVIDELAKATYGGRQAGTPEYAKAVDYIGQQMRDVGMQQMFNTSDFQLPYIASKAVLSAENVALNGRRLQLGADYQPFARTPSVSLSLNAAYYAGDGQNSDYSGKVSGLVIFHWNRTDGTFGGGILDRIQSAISHGAQAVAIVADGELAVTNSEHPLIASSINVPAIYVSPSAAKSAGIPSDYSPRWIPDLKFSYALTIARDSAAPASDLVGVIPGKSESHSILWVTNIDGFGQMPAGAGFPSAVAGSTGAAMMLDLAQGYGASKPNFTQIFAFVGSKWTDQAGISELAKRLNWTHIDAVIDVYAMGGTGSRDRINVMYTDPSFASIAKQVQPSSQMNTDLGNALSSVLVATSKKVLLIRDLDTWIDDSASDTPARISETAYTTGLQSLQSIGNELMNALPDQEVALPLGTTFQPTQLDVSQLDLRRLETDHFKIYTTAKQLGLFTPSLLSTMESIYLTDGFYNYDPLPKSKITALFISDGVAAARICQRNDLISNPSAAGGGFANAVEGDGCYFQARTGDLSEPIWYVNIAHELNHDLASIQDFYPLQSGLQEWQGQSHFVRYSSSGVLLTSSIDVVHALLGNSEVPKLDSLIADYSKNIDWGWFTDGKTNPDGWLYTYFLAGSMYAYLNDQYGEHAARRAMYRNYANVSKFKENMSADTGMTFEDFCKAWAYWMLHNGVAQIAVSTAVKLAVDQNNAFDNALLYTRPSQSDTSGAKSNGTSKPTSEDLSFTADRLNGDLASSSAAGVKIKTLMVMQSDSEYSVTMQLESEKARMFAAFIPPGDSLAFAYIDQGSNTITFTMSKAKIENQALLMFNFFTSDTDRAFISVPVPGLISALMTATVTPAPVASPSPSPSESTSSLPKSPTVKKVSSKKTITCVKGKVIKKITSVSPKCPAGYKRK